MPAKNPRLYLVHICECCERILDYTGGIESMWPDVPVVHDAVCRNLEIIGEAARRFDDAFRLAHAEIPWRAMTDVRNILIHAYDQVAAEILVDIVRQDIPPLLASVKSILEQPPDS
ncbi:MAG: HepT-like ribonuclease domain-containing protein [Bryobacteraceae bacterium]